MSYVIQATWTSFSPNHSDPPLYNGGQGSTWDYISIIHGTHITDGSDIPSGDPVHVRTRGAHDPGDGEYTNRWAFPPEGKATARLPETGGRRLVFSSSASFDWQRDYNPGADYRQCYEHWDGSSHILTRVWDRYNMHRQYYVRARCYWYQRDNVVFKKSGSALYAVVNVRYYDYKPSELYDDPGECANAAASAHAMLSSYSYDHPPMGSGLITNSYQLVLGYDDELVVDKADARLSPEMNIFADSVTMLPHTHIGTLEAEAYRRAVDALPHAGMNNIANVVEVISLINNMLFSGGLTSIGTVSDAWLAYRYAYSTTKSDIKELAALVERLDNLTRTTAVTTRAVVYDGEYTVRCSIQLSSAELSNVHSFAERWGLKLSGYNIWDMVPYSFIVDWFLDVGGKLERGESIQYAYSCKKPAWFSVERKWINEYDCKEIFYHRHYAMPNLSEAYLYRTVNDPSGVTIIKRVIDALAIVR